MKKKKKQVAIFRLRNDQQKKLIKQLAKTLKTDVKIISEEQLEDLFLLKAMNEARTSKTVPAEKVFKKLRTK